MHVLGKSSKTIPGEPFSSTEMIKKKPCSQTTLKTVSKLGRPNTPLGYGVCFLNLTFDGFTHAIQDSVTARYAGFIAKDRFLVVIYQKLLSTYYRGQQLTLAA
ncbi:UDP-galactose/UDP-glucose transporter 3-like isoform X3 [Papaver somniferum]|uniref:UDP-galactose/UDP-glucose transporter 3-like isoform X3 n=1 Tax=Papaver somniferum TaxID=3469 RepID=UPI000E6F84A1|nr:UDP-galactose/UDP-glucose transporter 3-like isoform X3 [Papaver somniferum]